MKAGLTVEACGAATARSLAWQADRAGSPGTWGGRGCAMAGFPDGSIVQPDDLAELVARFGASDVIIAADASAGEVGERERARSRRDGSWTLAAYEHDGHVPGGQDLGPAWVIATFLHERDDQTDVRRLHTHNLVILLHPAELSYLAQQA